VISILVNVYVKQKKTTPRKKREGISMRYIANGFTNIEWWKINEVILPFQTHIYNANSRKMCEIVCVCWTHP
jgi:uncharacterized protein with NRDE domain